MLPDHSAEEVRVLLARELRLPLVRVLPTTSLARDGGLDSLGVVRLLATIEEELAVELRDDDYIAIRCVADVVQSVRRARAATRGRS